MPLQPLERRITLRALYHAMRSDLRWHWLQGQELGGRSLSGDPWADQDAGGAALVGFFNFIRPHAIQVLGRTELAYLEQSGEGIDHFFPPALLALVIGERQPVPALLLEQLRQRKIALFVTHLGARHVLSRLQHYLYRVLAARQLVHGVLVDVLGLGILLQGEAGVGKSELALELVSRGHRLIADDSVLCIRTAPDVISGECPPPLRNFLEVRGLGIINIRDLFGAAAIARSKRVRLVVEIRRMDDTEMADMDRLQGAVGHLAILDVLLPLLRLPVTPARNLAVLVEAAARSQYLKESGVDMLADFDAQVRRAAAEE